MTLAEVKALAVGDVICYYGAFNSDGTCQRWHVNGAVQTWVTRPDHVKVPIKHGMYSYSYLTQSNMHLFHKYGTCPKC